MSRWNDHWHGQDEEWDGEELVEVKSEKIFGIGSSVIYNVT